MDVLLAKILSLLGIFVFSILFGIAPLYLKKCVRSPKVKWVNNAIICFSGGTLLGISFLHLMPEMRESHQRLIHRGYYSSFPNKHVSMVDVIICGGFFFIYILDELIHLLLEKLGGTSSHQPHGQKLSGADFHQEVKTESSKKDEATSTIDLELGVVEQQDRDVPTTNTVHIPGLLTIIALSFHDIFEGLALGIQDHDYDVLFLFLSVATHKYAIAFAVSLDLLLSNVNAKTIVIYTVCFSIVNPFGIGLGLFMDIFSKEGTVESPMTVVMQGISSGSLIYVTCFEVLQRHSGDRGGHLGGIRNTFFVILGFVFVLLLKVFMPHKHLEHYNH